MSAAFAHADLAQLFGHFMMLSLLSIGGAMATAPEMHRYLVGDRGWLSDSEFTSAVALAQAAPGPNVLFVPVLGFQVAGAIGAAAALVGILLPSTLLSLTVSRWGARRRETLAVRAFTTGLAPVTVALMFIAAWVLAQPYMRDQSHLFGAFGLMALTVFAMLRTTVAPIWLIAIGAVIGLAGWV